MILGFAVILVGSPLIHAEPNENASSTGSPAIQTIAFKDGTVLKGNLSAVADGYYIIDTVNLGQVRVPVEKVASITAGGVTTPQAVPQVTLPAGTSESTSTQSAINNLLASQPQLAEPISQAQKNILNDPQMMAEIQTMLQDPKIMNLLKDKSVMQDVIGMNPETIQNNPNIQALMQNPKMQNLLNQLSEKMGTRGTSSSQLSAPATH